MEELTLEQKKLVTEVLAGVMGVTESLAEILPSVLAIRATLRCTLFLVENFMKNGLPMKEQFCNNELKKMVVKELFSETRKTSSVPN